MKPVLARGLTYGAVGTLGAVAVILTPPLPNSAAPFGSSAAPVVASVAGATVTPAGAVPAGPISTADAPAAATIPVLPTVDADGTIHMPATTVVAQRLNGIDTVLVSGTVKSSLYASLDHVAQADLPSGQRHSLAWRLADIFEHRADLSRDLDDGDTFHILVERLQQPNGKIIIRSILGARLSLGDKVLEAVHFKARGSSSEWFDGKGRSLTASFLHAPVDFRRISSSFGLREHPIFGTWKNHTGTDYAAAMGTPVRAIGDGVVVSAGWRGGYGNCIDIRHPNGYISRYGHLRGFARGIRPGQQVAMGSTIGYVGMTGWATGPHLHFEIRVNGQPRDPRTALRGQDEAVVPASESRLFKEIRAHTLAAMNRESSTERVASR